MHNPTIVELQAAHAGVPVSEYIVAILNESGGVDGAAKEIGVQSRTLYRYMKRYGIGTETKYVIEVAQQGEDENEKAG